MAAASQDLVQCHAELKSSRKRPVTDTLAFSDVFTKEVLSKRIRKRNSDDKYELTNKGHHLVVVGATEVKELCFPESQLLFDPRGELPHHWPFLRHIVAIATQLTSPSLETTVLSQRRALLLNNNVFSSTTTTTTKFFVDLPLNAVTPFIAGLRPARATCRLLRDAMTGVLTTTLGNNREKRRLWEHNDAASIITEWWEPLVTEYARNRLKEILFRHLRLRPNAVSKREVNKAARFVMKNLDIMVLSDPAWRLVNEGLGLYKGCIAGFDETGAFIVAQDDYDGWQRKSLREIAETLNCMEGVMAEVLGPFEFPRRRDASSLMEKNPSYVYLRGYCLRRGQIWALRVARPVSGW